MRNRANSGCSLAEQSPRLVFQVGSMLYDPLEAFIRCIGYKNKLKHTQLVHISVNVHDAHEYDPFAIDIKFESVSFQNHYIILLIKTCKIAL